MAKYHINKHGEPAVCYAKIRCRMGENTEHFEGNLRGARVWAEEQNASAYENHVQQTSLSTKKPPRFFTVEDRLSYALSESVDFTKFKDSFAFSDSVAKGIKSHPESSRYFREVPERAIVGSVEVFLDIRDSEAKVSPGELTDYLSDYFLSSNGPWESN